MWAFMGSLLRSVALALLLVFLAPFVLTLLFFSVFLRKDEAHFSH
jgi:hypothetical protein